MSTIQTQRRDSEGVGPLHEEITACRACPRLVEWRERIARDKRRAYRDWTYWGRAVPGFGDPRAGLVIVGLAPAAHGANRTGRYFTGDRSGEFLLAGLHRAGFSNQPRSDHREDGLVLTDAFISAPCRCAPPDNKPLPEELARCAPFFDRELALLPVRVILALGAIAWNASLAWMQRTGVAIPSPRPAFGHGAELRLPGVPVLLGSYHVSQQNTQTGRLTPAMFDAVTARVRVVLAEPREECARGSLFA
ncbi:uracil-DNA glycosylase [Melittangium boletus]|uniref:Type-5 uracil-DNA glycosylase n=1 Tax=Melittangium boletus DSM 14713 TaxID=1294270 RepID=A0A250IQC0_9BACT|nr:uracil-DNA glycosylase [Melittangium boletus]ATB33442.1 uracil-DNA glycosylase [Melittangium boletus DSM 14713]